MNLICRLSFAALFVVSISRSSVAQTHSLALDATAGLNTSRGGEYVDRGGVGFELTAATGHQRATFVAFTLGGRGAISSGDKCVFSGPGATGRCLPNFPELLHLGVLGGLETDRGHLALRAMAGPAFYAGRGSSAIGAQVHTDAAVGGKHLALVVAARGSVMRRFNGERLGVGALEFGIRIR